MENANFELNKFDWSDLNVNNVNTFPAAEDLACLSYVVYFQKYGSRVTYDISEYGKNEPSIRPLPDSWKLIATAKSNVLSLSPPSIDGYNGAAYYNVSSKHLVIAHRGTSNFGSAWADLRGVIFNGYSTQVKSAYQFTRQIVDRFWECAISVSVTGHSLGGWLSQLSAYFIKHPLLAVDFEGIGSNLSVHVVDACKFNSSDHLPSHHLHIVAFDSPGALNAIKENLLKHFPRYPDNRFLRMKYLDDLDVTTYFSHPNFVNSLKMHIGSIFLMRNVSSHKMKSILQFWQSEEKQLHKVTDWLKGLTEQNLNHTKVQFDNELKNSKFSAEPIDISSVRMSVFESEECKFLEDILYVKEYGVIGQESSWQTIFKDKCTDKTNYIFSGGEFVDYTEAKDIFEFFGSFDIMDSQVLKVDKRFKLEFFIRLVKYFMRNFNLPAAVKEVISDFPKVYQAIYRAFNTEYLSSIAEVKAGDFPSLNEFLESSQLRFFQAVAVESPFICVANIVSFLKSKCFLFGGDLKLKLDPKHTLFLSSELLTTLDRHVSIAKIVSPNNGLKLIVIENSDEEIQPTLKYLIDKVLVESSSSIKLILVTRKKINFSNLFQIDITQFYYEKEMEESTQAVLFEYLSKDQQIKVLDSEICFQGEDMQLKKVVSLEELQSNPEALDKFTLHRLLLPKSKFCLGGCLNSLNEFERSYYIPRHFRKIVLEEPNQLLKIVSGNMTETVLIISYRGMDARNEIVSFLFSTGDNGAFEWQGTFEGFQSDKHKVILVEATTQLPNYNHYQSHFTEVRLPALWIIYDNSKWYWHLTFGQLCIKEFNVYYSEEQCSEEQCNEQEMLKLQRRLVIISDEPGMGKSTLLKKLAELCRDTGRVSFVILINLDSHIDLLRKWGKSGDLESVTNFVFQIGDSTSSSSVGKCFLQYLLQQEGRVTIFFDGLDEVDNEIQSKVKDIVLTLVDQTKAKIFLTSRDHLRSSLEQKFHCYSHRFLPLDDEEKVDFLKKFWIDHPTLQKFKGEYSPENVLSKFATEMLTTFRHSLNIDQVDLFIGVPLQLFMLGTVCLPLVCSILSEFLSNQGHIPDCTLQQYVVFDNIFDLYQIFVKEKFHISLKEKLKLQKLAENSPWYYRQLLTSLNEPHRTTSFRFLFPNEFQECFDGVSNIEDIQALLSVGIVHVQSDSIDLSSIQFIHRSLAEYFAADFLVNRLALSRWKENVISFLKKNYFKPQFAKIRFFVDHFITIQPECNPFFRKCLNFENEKQDIFDMLNRDKNAVIYDLLGRNVLHYAICYGERILWCLIQNQHLLDKTDVFGCDFMSYSLFVTSLKFPVSQSQDLSYYFTNPHNLSIVQGDLYNSLGMDPSNVVILVKQTTGPIKDLFFSKEQIDLTELIKNTKVRRYFKNSEDFELNDERLNEHPEIDETVVRSHLDISSGITTEFNENIIILLFAKKCGLIMNIIEDGNVIVIRTSFPYKTCTACTTCRA